MALIHRGIEISARGAPADARAAIENDSNLRQFPGAITPPNNVTKLNKEKGRSLSGFRPGWPTVIPRLFTNDVIGLVNFLRVTFHAQGDVRDGAPAEIRIGDSLIMISDGGGLRGHATGFLYVYVEDADTVYGSAIESGAISIEPPTDMPYGDRRAMVQDAWGNIWQIATHRGS